MIPAGPPFILGVGMAGLAEGGGLKPDDLAQRNAHKAAILLSLQVACFDSSFDGHYRAFPADCQAGGAETAIGGGGECGVVRVHDWICPFMSSAQSLTHA